MSISEPDRQALVGRAEALKPLLDVLPEPGLLVSGHGEILIASPRAHVALGTQADSLPGGFLSSLVTDEGIVLEALKRASASRAPVESRLQLRGSARFEHVTLRLVTPRSETLPALLLVQLRGARTVASRFPVLNEQIRALRVENRRRAQAEAALRDQIELAQFGRDMGIALAQSEHLDVTLARCADLMVERLDAALARIWVADPGGETLHLRASAGLHMHVDGRHAQIAFGSHKIGWIAESQRPHLTNSVIGDARIHDQAWAKREGLVGFAGYPLVVEGRTVGVMAMFSRHAIPPRSLDAIDSVANGVALVIERHRIQADLAGQTRALRIADERKNEFLALLGHELRNPLAPIVAGMDLLERDPEDSKTLQIMRRHVGLLVRLVDDLLEISRVTQGLIELQQTVEPIEAIADQALDTVREEARKKNLAVRFQTPPEPAFVEGDAVRLAQVLSNLLHNAVKYTPEGGEVSVSIEALADAVVVRVRDTGIGIEEAVQESIFEVFVQARPTLDRPLGGLGIGLTVARRLVAMHGGQISVHSEGAGRGSEFTVRLPRAAATEAAGPEPARTEDAPSGLRLLVVDDNTDSARSTARLLELALGATVDVAFDGEECLRRATALRPDAVLLDIGLPGLDGYEVTRRLRQLPETAGTLVVAVSGYGGPEIEEKAREAGFDRCLVKPVTLDGYRAVLAALSAPSDSE